MSSVVENCRKNESNIDVWLNLPLQIDRSVNNSEVSADFLYTLTLLMIVKINLQGIGSS